jgi:large subunit ribosomal protein L21
MYAIIKSGSRQYQVQPESVIAVNRLPLEQGAAFETDQVLLLEQDGGAVQIGTPYVSGALVKGRVLSHPRDRKVLVFKMKRRKNYRRTRGHRQELTQVRIESIELGGKVIAEAKPLEKPAKASRKPKAEAEAAAAAAKPAARPAAKSAPKAGTKAATGKAAKSAAKAGAKPAARKAARSAAKAGTKPAARKAAKGAAKAGAKPAARKAAKSTAKRSGKDKGKK